jgi:DNA invertase Pin-like site-specific DNA recombinase
LKIDRASTHHQGELNMSRYGYARDRGEFSRARQVEALVASGIPEERIFRDAGGLAEPHPGLDALLAVLTWEDEIVTSAADRLVRGPAHTGPLIDALATSGATARTLDGVEIAGKIDVYRAQLAAAEAIRERERQLARPAAPDA